MDIVFNKRGIFQRLFGKCATECPANPSCWSYIDGVVVVDPEAAPELADRGGAIRIEGKALPDRLLLVHGEDGNYYAFRNKCSHSGRRMDPVPGTNTIQCCSIGKSTFDTKGTKLYGPPTGNIEIYVVELVDGRIKIKIA
jgi:nitrite reductase/ring-hydroxylating ferredoxin subunit